MHILFLEGTFLLGCMLGGVEASSQVPLFFDHKAYNECMASPSYFHPPVESGKPACEPSQFTRVSKLGSGASSSVFSATVSEVTLEQNSSLPKVVALKEIVGRKYFEQAHNEKCLLIASSHPNVPKLFCMYEEMGMVVLVMELVEGCTISQALQGQSRLDPAAVQSRWMDVLTTGLSVLQYYHDNGIVLRDLKPENVLVNIVEGKLHTTFIDFGVSGEICSNPRKPWKGTRYCWPPEYFEWEVDCELTFPIQNETADFYALGIVLLSLTTGKLPFANANKYTLKREIRTASWKGDLLAGAVQNELLEGLLRTPSAERFDHSKVLEWIRERKNTL